MKIKKSVLFAGGLLLLLLAVACPAQALTAKNLDITVHENGDADVVFDYELSLFENAAVFVQIVDPGSEIQKALEDTLQMPVQVTEADAGRVRLTILGFASKEVHDSTVTLITPSLSFQRAEQVLNQYWFAPLISPDFSPDLTTVAFPDGYTETFLNQNAIPGFVHTF